MNIVNPALLARAFLFFAYPAKMSGDKIWVAGMTAKDAVVDGLSGATPLGQAAAVTKEQLANGGFQIYDGLLSSVRLCFDLNSALPACTAGMFSSNVTLSLISVLGFVLKTFACDVQVPHPPEDTSSVRFREKSVFRTLGTRFCLLTDALSHATRKRRVLYSAPRQRLVLLHLTTLLVSNSYSPKLNPGPSTDHSSSPANSQSRSLSQTHSSWICGTCDLAVHWNDRGLVCDQFGQWFHGQCQSVDTINYGLLSDSSTQWFCAICGSRNSKAAFDLHGLDWTEASLPDSSLNCCTTPTDLQFQPQHASTPTRSYSYSRWPTG